MRFGPRKGKKKQVYFLGLQELEIVKVFKFLGVDLQQNLAWTYTKRRFAAKARSRLPMIYKATFERRPPKSAVSGFSCSESGFLLGVRILAGVRVLHLNSKGKY